MSNLMLFIQHNLLLCISLIIAIIIYIIFELRQSKANANSVCSQDAINLNSRKKGVFLDIRDGKSYNAAHIVGALHTSIENLKSSTKFLKKHQKNPIIIYCSTGAQAQLAYQLLKKDGFEQLYVLKGGFKQWLKDQLPIQSIKADDNSFKKSQTTKLESRKEKK